MLDLNADGNYDFNIFLTTFSSLASSYARLKMSSATAGIGVMTDYTTNVPFHIAKLYTSDVVTSNVWTASNYYLATAGWTLHSSWTNAPFANVSGAYVGLQFYIGGVAHGGFARFDVSTNGAVINATLTGYGYNDVTGEAHVQDVSGEAVPEPGTLGLLAVGLAGLAVWRRLKKQPS